ncbi:MAG: glycine--tRNA ligase subunit beta [Rhodobacteraceae bacterium]|nr:glycine--tRNA ligase subunit beta [Paracoccaceae bacterium]
MADLLIEIFSEEIPARMQTRAADDLKKLVTDGLVSAGLTYGDAAAFSTPRRLTLALGDLPATSPDTSEERKGPKVGAPDKALEGFLRGAGVAREDLVERDTPKGPVWFAMIEKKGRPAGDIIAEVLEAAIRNFPWPKSMRWGFGGLRWVRPIHSILCILSDEAGANVVPFDVDGIKAGDSTEGHRFMGAGRFTVSSFEDYEAKLAKNFVVLDAAARAEQIEHEAQNLAFAAGLELVEDKALLAEVAGLVEWPVVLMGDIAEDFAGLPWEVLKSSMREHQKYLSLRNPKTGQIEKFITVANRETADHGAAILAGNQKVLFARLSDAKFFWENDLRVSLEDMAAKLDNVTFHNKLGSQSERIGRITALAGEIAPQIGADTVLARQAAGIAKADLSSEMVGEFPDLQGLMGRYYANAAGLPDEVATACEAHYAPLGPSDEVPEGPVSVAVALADKLDLLTGFWSIDEKPTGSKDPFALRRAALGVIRIILANRLRLRLDRFIDSQLLKHEIALNRREAGEGELKALDDILDQIADHGVFGAAYRAVLEKLDGDDKPDTGEGSLLGQIGAKMPDLSVDLLNFLHDRLKVYLKSEGIRHDVIDACLHMPASDDLTLLVNRAQALSAFLATEDGENLLQGYRRAANILAQAEKADGVEYSYGADAKFAESDEEKALFTALDKASVVIDPAIRDEDFVKAMAAIATLRAPIDAFFEAVQINTDNQVVRRNRLNLLARIRDICRSVADLNRIEG